MTVLCVLLVVCIATAIFARRSRVPAVLALVCLFLYCWPPIGWLAAASLERRYPITEFPSGEADAIVVLSANVFPANPSQREALPGFFTYTRCAHAAWLFTHWKRLPIVVSGGTGIAGSPVVAAIMKRTLVEMGVPESMIVEEARSANTFENAVEVADILQPRGIRRIALVTEGYHMRRAELCFRKQGFEVTPSPCAYHTFELISAADWLVPRPWAITVNDQCWHEWVGMAVYKLKGRI